MSYVEANAAKRPEGLRACADGLSVNPDIDFAQKCMGYAADRMEYLEQELENRDALSIHSCHTNCQRPMCVLRRELAEARTVADDWRNKALYWRTGQSPATVSYIYAFPWETHLTSDAQPQIPHEKHP